MTSLLLVIVSTCQMYSVTLLPVLNQIDCQQKLIKCAQGNDSQFYTMTSTEARLAQCIKDGVHQK